MLIGCIFLASLCFSVFVEAIQTLVHIEDQDEMHFPLVILMVGAVGLLLNGFCYFLIGGKNHPTFHTFFFLIGSILILLSLLLFTGYTFHQGSYLHVTENGEVILERSVTIDSLSKGQRRLSSQSRKTPTPPPSYTPSKRQGSKEMIRDIIGICT